MKAELYMYMYMYIVYLYTSMSVHVHVQVQGVILFFHTSIKAYLLFTAAKGVMVHMYMHMYNVLRICMYTCTF